ncbi:MAG: hypothetical protein HY691_10420 [Chloroflexi bacterium]|nr:hypothetical protein [Chloroflexota bacterium]
MAEARRGPLRSRPVSVPGSISPGNVQRWTAHFARVHITARTGEHCGQLDAIAGAFVPR